MEIIFVRKLQLSREGFQIVLLSIRGIWYFSAEKHGNTILLRFKLHKYRYNYFANHTCPDFLWVNVNGVTSDHTLNALRTSSSVSDLPTSFGYLDILYVKSFTLHLLPIINTHIHMIYIIIIIIINVYIQYTH